jgi:glycosyltransferase involved in cell wall biosynthesis
MKVLMLGWEYPPHISGGLGTACAGLTAALADKGVDIHFIVPKVIGDEVVPHMAFTDSRGCASSTKKMEDNELGKTEVTRLPAFLNPYWNQKHFAAAVASSHVSSARLSSKIGVPEVDAVSQALEDGEVFGVNPASESREGGSAERHKIAQGLFSEVERFTADILSRFANGDFDLIHAHDWMTFPAAVALSHTTGRPMIAHVHSLEHDRSGLFYDREIDAIERFGLRSANKIIAVSHYTKKSIERNHLIPGDRVEVVHNGIYPRQVITDYRGRKTWPKHVVLFLGRVTYQKGPDYFVEVANKVIPHLDDVLFVLAGSGDMLPELQSRVRELNLDQHFLFPGFVQGEELEELFSVADLYVMPSVSEPFGIAALEAISFNTPTILSKQSGVAEVIEHALKVDFWDIDRMADLIINALNYSELRVELVENAKNEVARLHWGVAAERVTEIYGQVIESRKTK